MNTENKSGFMLTPDTKVLELIKEYPFLVDKLAELSPRYEKLKNPILRNTIGKVATLRMAAVMGSIPMDKLVESIAQSIEENTGQKLDLDNFSGPHDERLDILKGIILSLHTGEDVEEAKIRFKESFSDISSTEIAQMEQQLISEGLPAEDVKSLCDVHVSLFKDSLDGHDRAEMTPGHPVQTMYAENAAIMNVTTEIRELVNACDGKPDPFSHPEIWTEISEKLETLGEIEKHYVRKENQLFPILEQKDFSGPSQVMWALHDDVRKMLKDVKAKMEKGDSADLGEELKELLKTIDEMVYKEGAILIPTSMELLAHEDWAEIHKSEEEIGFTLIQRGSDWNPRIKIAKPKQYDTTTGADKINKFRKSNSPEVEKEKNDSDLIDLDVGKLTIKQINQILLHLPVELSFVDENDKVCYYTGVDHKIFPRMPGVIGREVRNCHPPKSLHMVDKILTDFKSGAADTANFWMEDFMGKFVIIRYDAVRDENGKYIGCLESVQDVTKIRTLEGNQRLLDYDK